MVRLSPLHREPLRAEPGPSTSGLQPTNASHDDGYSTDQAHVCQGIPHRASAPLPADVRLSKPRRRKRGRETLGDDLFGPKQLGTLAVLGLMPSAPAPMVR